MYLNFTTNAMIAASGILVLAAVITLVINEM